MKSTGYGESCTPFFIFSCGFSKIALFRLDFRPENGHSVFPEKGFIIWKVWGDAERLGESLKGGINCQGSQRESNRIAFHSNEAMRYARPCTWIAHRTLSMRNTMRSYLSMSVILSTALPFSLGRIAQKF